MKKLLLAAILLITFASCKKEVPQTEDLKPIYLYIEMQNVDGTITNTQIIKL